MTERAIWLKRDGTDTVVCVEAGGQWVEVIREPVDCPFSHIVEPSGIEKAIEDEDKFQGLCGLLREAADAGLLQRP